MKLFVPVVLFLATAAAFGAGQPRQFMIRGWVFEAPDFLVQKIHEGPDFTVTYLSSEEKKMWLGIYEGGHPQESATERPGLRHEQEKIGGQMATWALWDDEKEGEKIFRTEVFLLINPESKQSGKFHLFASAKSSADLDLLRAIVRSAHHQVEANQKAQPSG